MVRARQPRLRLILLNGSDVGREWVVEAEARIGRSPDNPIRLDEPGVSRRHARIAYRDGAFWIEDLGSSNGTRVGGQRVERARLEDGTVVELGPARLRCRLEDPAPGRPEPARSPGIRAAPLPPPRKDPIRARPAPSPFDDLAQSAPWVRLLAWTVAIAAGALVFYLTYRMAAG